MRFVALAIILASLPVFIGLLGKNTRNRDWAMAAIGLLLFLVGALQVDAAIISWPAWPGSSKGILVSPVDMLALAMIATRPGRDNRIPFAGLSVLWLIPTALSLFPSNVPMASAFVLAQGVQLILFATAVAGELTRPSALPRLVQGLSLGLIIQASFVVQQKLTGVIQATGTMGHQNSLGMMVELSVLPLIGYVLEGGKGRLCYAGVAAGLLIAAGGGSRGTLLFLALGISVLLLFSLLRGMTPRKGKILALGVGAAVVFVPLALATLKDRFGEHTMVTEEAEREAFKRAARMIADDHPLGAGANMYISVANAEGYSKRAGVNWNTGSRAAAVHNAFLLARAETGRAGEIALYLLILAVVWRGLTTGRRIQAPLLGGATIGAGAAAVAILAHNHFEFVFSYGVIQRFFWLNAGIVFACAMVERRLSVARRQRETALVRERARVPSDTGDHDSAPASLRGGERA
ncbi:MAG: hypothetical protein JNJ92_07350 [Altererythrobacter sp.]|nr:hypothetical protein [Altererythrobacter sp.]